MMLLVFVEFTLMLTSWLLISIASFFSVVGGYGNINIMLYSAPPPLVMLGSSQGVTEDFGLIGYRVLTGISPKFGL
jgi:hypothetical protein